MHIGLCREHRLHAYKCKCEICYQTNCILSITCDESLYAYILVTESIMR